MAQKSLIALSALKVVNPKGQVLYDGTGKDFTFHLNGQTAVFTAYGTEDTIMQTSDGWVVTFKEEYADVNTDMSATDLTGS